VSLEAIVPEGATHPGLDTLYDFHAFVRSGPIARLPAGAVGKKVAIVGAGAAGLVAAYELLRIGVEPVVFEATDRVGGRAYSLPFQDGGAPSANAFAEMGAMRFPLSARVFFHYARDVFRMRSSGQFPDPGKVYTRLYYQNSLIDWPAGSPAPDDEGFRRIGRDWSAFVRGLLGPLERCRRAGRREGTRACWQELIHRFANKSFYAALREGIPHWGGEDVNKFAALGIGSGGFGPLFQVGFLEILRIVAHGWEEDQQLLPGGISRLMESFCTAEVVQPDGTRTSLQQRGAVRLRCPVRALERAPGGVLVHLEERGARRSELFPAVIVATTTRAMELIGLTAGGRRAGAVLSQPVKVAVRNLHLMSSSKLFIRTATKFWLEAPDRIPQTILTDELPRAVYALDYPQLAEGVVLISYSWGDDSAKLMGLAKEERLRLCREVIREVSREFADNLEPVNGEVLSVDWDREPFHHGAFKLQYPGQEADLQAAYFQFLSVNDPATDTGCYLAGDSVSWSGGWVEGAMHTGLNAACAAAKRLGAILGPNSPLSQSPRLYDYEAPAPAGAVLPAVGWPGEAVPALSV
jgi:tryptophan 2-monooxygenase